MSALLGVFATRRPLPSAASLPVDRGAVAGTWRDEAERALLHARRPRWLHEEEDACAPLVFVADDVVVAADATLYHTADLVRSLSARGVEVRGRSAAELIAAAYRAWGRTLLDHLEGDFAFVLWDRRTRRALAARDFTGRRPLFFTTAGEGFVVASTTRAVLAASGAPADLNLANLGSQAAGLLWSSGSDTAFARVHVLPAASLVEWSEAGLDGPRRYWSPPLQEVAPRPLDEAAEELRELLAAAVHTRLARGSTTVWMSGGWDSTAVFGAGQYALRNDAAGSRLRPVSISYPQDDPGYEDPWIEACADRWGANVHWLDSRSIPLLEGLAERAAAADEPPAHLYELWNRALARGTRAAGARVALDGNGGDSAFQVSDIRLFDLLRAGRLLQLRNELRTRRLPWSRLRRFLIEPAVPALAWPAIDRLYGRRVRRHYLERPIAEWIRPDFAVEHRLFERELAQLRSASAPSRAQAENHLYLTASVWAWGASFMTNALLEEGVEGRSPLLDRRIVEFALRRPTLERAAGLETKSLLRRAMRDLLPDDVLAPRPHRTGVTIGYSRGRMRSEYPPLLERLFAEPLLLEELGILDATRLRRAAERWAHDDFRRVNLFHAMKTEFWLRGLRGTAAARPSAA